MKLYHTTTAANLTSIREQGLLVSKADATAKIKAVWLATSSNRAWAVLHTLKKHKVTLDNVAVIEVDVPRAMLQRFRKGFWYCTHNVPPAYLGPVIQGTAFGVGVSE